MLYNFAVAASIGAFEAVRLTSLGHPGLAGVDLWLVLQVNIALPVAILATQRARPWLLPISVACGFALSLALAKELGPRNIRVNTVAPGYTDTEGNQRSGFIGSAKGQALAAATPLGGRFGQPEDIVPAVVFLASDDAAWLTGERLNASGGVR